MSNGGRRWNQRYGGSIADQYLRDNGLRKKSVPRDGCCLFRAVAEQVYLTQTTHWELRRLCANYIKSNPSQFRSFLTVSLKDYCWKLSNCTLWGGEMELVALSELLGQTIIVYQEQDGKMVTQHFEPKKELHKPQVLLLFSGNNHYDSLWESEEESIASFCQSILYELLIETVTKSKMHHRDLSSAIRMRGGDFNYRYTNSHSSLLDRYPTDLLRGLAALTYFNIPYIVYRREKEAREKADRRLAIKMQFTIGDKCQITLNGKQYTGDIVSGLTNSIVHVFVPELEKKVKVPINEIMLMQQQQHQRKSNHKSRNRSNTGSGREESNGRKSYSKSSKTQQTRQDRTQRPPLVEKKEVTEILTPQPSYTKQDDNGVIVGEPSYTKQDNNTVIVDGQLKDEQSCNKITPDSLFDQASVFSDTTVRVSSLMGRGNPLEIFNQESLACISEAPESEWPILHASGGRGGGRIGTIVLSGSNPQRCHLDGPPPPEQYQTQQSSFYSQNVVAFLIQEMNPPLHLLKTGTPEGRQQFMYEFAQNSLRFYSKYVPNSELEDTLHELLCMEFDEFITSSSQYNDGEFSVLTSSSRDDSQSDIRDHSQSNTPRISEEDHTSSDAHTGSPHHDATLVLTPPPSTIVTTPISPSTIVTTPISPSTIVTTPISPSTQVIVPTSSSQVTTPILPIDIANDKEEVAHEEMPTEGSQPEDPMNIGGHYQQQPPMMFPPSTHPPYGFSGYPYPMMFPGPMIPWPYYHPMSGGPYMMPPQMLPPQMRLQLMESSPANEEQMNRDAEESHGGSEENVSIEEVIVTAEEDTPINKQDTPTIRQDDSNVPVPKPLEEEIDSNQNTKDTDNELQKTRVTNKDGGEERNKTGAGGNYGTITGISRNLKQKAPRGGGNVTNKGTGGNNNNRKSHNYTSRRNTKHQYYDYHHDQRKRDN